MNDIEKEIIEALNSKDNKKNVQKNVQNACVAPQNGMTKSEYFCIFTNIIGIISVICWCIGIFNDISKLLTIGYIGFAYIIIVYIIVRIYERKK